MKNFLFVFIMALLLMSCGGREVEEGYADEGLVRRGLQINIYETTISTGYQKFIEEENDSSVVDSLREEADGCDSLLVSCLIIEDMSQDTIINIFDIK